MQGVIKIHQIVVKYVEFDNISHNDYMEKGYLNTWYKCVS